jgi:hypothetical protein
VSIEDCLVGQRIVHALCVALAHSLERSVGRTLNTGRIAVTFEGVFG